MESELWSSSASCSSIRSLLLFSTPSDRRWPALAVFNCIRSSSGYQTMMGFFSFQSSFRSSCPNGRESLCSTIMLRITSFTIPFCAELSLLLSMACFPFSTRTFPELTYPSFSTLTSSTGLKTRHFGTIISELTTCLRIHAENGSRLGGVSLEFTGELNDEGFSVTECLGGSMELSEEQLELRYQVSVFRRCRLCSSSLGMYCVWR